MKTSLCMRYKVLLKDTDKCMLYYTNSEPDFLKFFLSAKLVVGVCVCVCVCVCTSVRARMRVATPKATKNYL